MTCSRCRREIEPGETTWPVAGAEGCEQCEDCYKDEYGPSWWSLLDADPDAEEIVN